MGTHTCKPTAYHTPGHDDWEARCVVVSAPDGLAPVWTPHSTLCTSVSLFSKWERWTRWCMRSFYNLGNAERQIWHSEILRTGSERYLGHLHVTKQSWSYPQGIIILKAGCCFPFKLSFWVKFELILWELAVWQFPALFTNVSFRIPTRILSYR